MLVHVGSGQSVHTKRAAACLCTLPSFLAQPDEKSAQCTVCMLTSWCVQLLQR